MRPTLLLAVLSLVATVVGAPPPATRTPLRQVVDLNVGEAQQVRFPDGATAGVRLINVAVAKDSSSEAVRDARVTLEVNGTTVTLGCANYTLPVAVGGVQVDCTIVKAYYENTHRDAWGLEKDARVRLWPAGSPLIAPGTFGYPIRQKWFATGTQFSNEPTHVDGSDKPERKKIYYHNDLDFGGCEGLTEIIAATDGIVVSVAGKTLPGYEGTPARPRYDVVYLLDDRGWFYRYSHMHTIDPGIRLGGKVTRGQQIGILGKEGGSGGWSHLHFGIVARQPSGQWGTEEAYAYAWEAYRNEFNPTIIAVARPHHLVRTGEKLVLDGSKSWSAAGKIAGHAWTFGDGSTARGATVERVYEKAGSYSEVLKVTDARGHTAYDFASVQVIDPARPTQLPPTLHPTFHPTTGIKAGEEVTFKVRAFRTTHGSERWNFGDGTPAVMVKSNGAPDTHAKDGYAATTHRFAKPGTYLVSVERANEHGDHAVGRLVVEVGR